MSDEVEAGCGEGGSSFRKNELRGAGLKEFEKFLLANDPEKVYEKLLERVQRDGVVIWQSPGTIAAEEAPNERWGARGWEVPYPAAQTRGGKGDGL